jgi:hypothetical protein
MSTHAQMWRLVQVLWHLTVTNCVHIKSVPTFPLHVCTCSDLKTCPSTRARNSSWLCAHHDISVPKCLSLLRCENLSYYYGTLQLLTVCVHDIISAHICPTFMSMPGCKDLSKYYGTWQLMIVYVHHIINLAHSLHMSAQAQIWRLVQLLWHVGATDCVFAQYHNCCHMSELAQMWILVKYYGT